MIITFYSNYLTHHQIPFCNALNSMGEVQFFFVSTQPMEEERRTGGWEFKEVYPYELCAFESNEKEQMAEELAIDSDVVIIGSAPEKYVEIRMKSAEKKLTFRYSERIYKRGRWRVLSPRGMWVRYKTYFRYIDKPLYMLCASSYTAGDLAMLGSYLGRCYKWGYFPETKRYDDIEGVVERKEQNAILWAGRLIGWKHPEMAIEVAKRLKDEGLVFHLNIVGDGPLRKNLQKDIEINGLQENVSLLGSVPAAEVRKYMEASSLFLSTSDQNEGWGAVVNEAMNSGCAVVVSKAVGAAGFLICDDNNGLTFRSGDIDELYNKVKQLLQDNDKEKALGREAYTTITDLWCAEIAAHRFVATAKSILSGRREFFSSGPCSKANIFSK